MKQTSIHALLGCLLFSSAVMAENSQPQRPMGPPPSFSDTDTNGDGVLTKDELKGPMLNDFSQIDQNGDGQITEDELNQHMQNHQPPQPPENN